MANLLIVIASTRPGRVGLPVANWFEQRVAAHAGFDYEVVDLAELDLPFLNEPSHPRLRQYTKEHTHAWSATVQRADALVFVTAEYNHGYPAPLKNAIDYLHHEWHYKPVGFVSYGGVAAGTRAVQQLKPVVASVHMMPAVAAVNIPFIAERVKDGVLEANQIMADGASDMLDELMAVQEALRPLRSGA